MTTTVPTVTAPARGLAPRVLTTAGGLALATGAGLFFAGLATSPAQVSDAKTDYLASLARDPLLTQVSAVLLHYGNLLIGLGALVLPFLVRGSRGAAVTLAGALATTLVFVNTSGSLLSDWFHMEIGRQLPLDVGARLSDSVFDHVLNTLSFKPGPLTLVALLVLFAGLARAGVVGWWSLAGLVLGTAGLMFLPYDQPILPALGTLPMLATIAFAGVRTLRRPR